MRPHFGALGDAVLEVPGLSCAAHVLYRRLLSVSAVPLTGNHGIEAATIAELTNAGLALRLPDEHPAHPVAIDEPRLVATTPDEALARLLIAEEKRLNARQERLLEVRNELAGLRASFETARGGSRPTGLVEIIVGRAAIEAAHRAVHVAAQRELSICDTAYFDVPPETPVVILPEPTKLMAGLRFRTIYDHSIFDLDPEHGAITLSESLAGGEIQRLVPELPLKFVLADESLALVALTLTGLDGALLVRSGPFLQLLRLYFELLWQRAVPIGGEDETANEHEMYGAIPRLLATGLSDDAVARQLGLSVRSVRRKIAEMMDDLGAVTRFQAGVLAERAGLLESHIDLLLPAPAEAPDAIDLREVVECSTL